MTINDLGIQEGAFDRQEAFILITARSSTNLMCFRREYQKRVKITEYPLHQLIRLGRLEIHIALSNSNIDVRIFAQGQTYS